MEIGKSSNPDSTPEILTTTIIVNSKAVAEVTIRGPLLACTPPYSDHFLTIINWRERTGTHLNCLIETGEIVDGYQRTVRLFLTAFTDIDHSSRLLRAWIVHVFIPIYPSSLHWTNLVTYQELEIRPFFVLTYPILFLRSVKQHRTMTRSGPHVQSYPP